MSRPPQEVPGVSLSTASVYPENCAAAFQHAAEVAVAKDLALADRAAVDAGFRVRERPVTRDELRNEYVGPAFVDYLADGWDGLVTS